MDFKRGESGTYEVIGIIGLLVVAILFAAVLGVYDPTRQLEYGTLTAAVDDGLAARGFVPDLAPTSTVDVIVAVDRVTRQYSFAASVSATDMPALQKALDTRGFEPTSALAPAVERLTGIDPYGEQERAGVDLRYLRETTATVEFAAIDTDGLRLYVVRATKPEEAK